MTFRPFTFSFFFFNDTATTEIYTLSLHDALPIYGAVGGLHQRLRQGLPAEVRGDQRRARRRDRKSTRLNSSHSQISYAVFCLKKKKKTNISFLLFTDANTSAKHTLLIFLCYLVNP